MRPFWQKDAFWFVVMPSALVALVFALAWLMRWMG